VEAEEVETLLATGEPHDPGLVGMQLQSQRRKDRRHPSQRLFGARPASAEHDEESRRGESHPPPLAEPCVNLSAYTAPIVQPPGFKPMRQWANNCGDRREASASSSPARFSRRRSRLYLRMAQRTR
jgi:hypothetical protein